MSETTAATRERWAMERAVRRRVAEEIAVMTLAARHADCSEEGRTGCDVCWALGEVASRAREIGAKP